jgi:hypothetical protein
MIDATTLGDFRNALKKVQFSLSIHVAPVSVRKFYRVGTGMWVSERLVIVAPTRAADRVGS